MPFIGRDWRSPGEAWVKTESLGWQRMKMIATHLHPSCHQHQSLARSWPPPSQAGQHMVRNCARSDSSAQDQTNGKQTARDCDENSLDGSRSSDTSSMQCHYPMRISSPYGCHTCDERHISRNCTNLPSSSLTCSCRDQDNSIRSVHMPRSLSRDSIRPSTLQNFSSTDSIRTLKHKNNFSNLSSGNIIKTLDQYNSDLIQNSENKKNDEKCPVTGEDIKMQSNPIILKNGNRWLDGDEQVNQVAQEVTALDHDSSQVQNQIHCCYCNQHFGPTDRRILENTAPHCRVSVRTREVAIYNTISEAFYRLDFYNAIHDIRRFNYVCKLLHLLITQNLTSLSGCATKVLFTMLEQVAWEVSSNKRNIHVIRNLLEELKQSIQKYYCWGRPIGSSVLWQQHFDTIERISRIVDEITLSQATSESQMTFDKLPIEMVREILLRLNDYRDLVNSAQASPVMSNMIDEQYIWQKLCRYHFTDQQLKMAFENSNYLNRVKRSTLRGVKYSRTVSADGKVSYRSLVARKRINAKNSMKNDRPESENRRSGESNGGTSSNSGSESDGSSNQFASHVVKTIRIFDRQGTSATLSRPSSSAVANDCSRPTVGQALEPKDSDENDNSKAKSCTSARAGPSRGRDLKDSRRPISDVDWELVFHQLRKKFNLKEEYADCLLLCRHCRCLFWKSIGHPCVRSEEDREPHPRHGGSRVAQHEQDSGARNSTTPGGVSYRPSVASLSRAFDPARRNLPSENRFARDNNVFDHAASDQSGAPVNLISGIQAINQRVLREANARTPPNNRASRSDRDELVPKHITITPQAFLNFFSL